MPSKYKFTSQLESKFTTVKKTLREIICKERYVCITTDVWSSRAQSYLGVTIHLLNTSFQRESYLLAFKELKNRQTYKELAEALNEVFEDYGIKIAQITNIVTDGGGSFCKMFKEYGSLPDATFENNEFDEESSDDNVDLDVIRPFMQDINGELFASELIDFDAPNKEKQKTNDELTNYLNGNVQINPPRIEMPKQRRCVSHLLNLLSKDFYKKLTGVAKLGLVAVLSKLHSLWVLTHKNSRAKTICIDTLGKCLLVPCETRWNSQFDAVKRCLEPEIQPKLNKLIEALKKAEIEPAKNMELMDENDFLILENYIKVMEPVAISLDKMQAEYNGSQGFILPVLSSMKHHVSKLSQTTTIMLDFKQCMLSVIDKRFDKYFPLTDIDKDLVVAAVTVPQFKTNFLPSDEEIIFAKSLLTTECKKIAIQNSIENDRNIEESSKDVPVDDFIVSYACNRNIRRNSIESDVESEVARFLVDVRTQTEILNEYPNVKEAYLKFNTTLSSSAPVERVFSQSMMIFTPRRNRISAKHFEMALFLKVNRLIPQKIND